MHTVAVQELKQFIASGVESLTEKQCLSQECRQMTRDNLFLVIDRMITLGKSKNSSHTLYPSDFAEAKKKSCPLWPFV